MLLNRLSFYKVTYITSYLNLVDYDWQKFGRKRMIKVMEHSVIAKKDKEEKAMTRLALKWLKDYDYEDFRLKIDRLKDRRQILIFLIGEPLPYVVRCELESLRNLKDRDRFLYIC